MNPKALFFCAALLCANAIFNHLSAQRVDLDNKAVPTPFIELPKKPLPADYTTYGATISAKPDQLRRCNLTETALQSYLNLPGFQKLNQGGHFHVEVVIDDFSVSSTSIQSKTETSKDKDGKQTSTTTYWVQAIYAIPIQLKVTNFQGNVIEETILSSMEKTGTHVSKAFYSSSQAQDHWSKNRVSELSKVEQNAIQSAFSTISAQLKNNYAYDPRPRSTSVFQYVDSKKLPDFEGFDKAFTVLSESFAKMKYDEPLDEVKAGMQPAIDYWLANKDRFDQEDKQQRKLKFACLYNLTNAYFWTEQFDLAAQYAKELAAMDYKEGKADNFLDNIKKVKEDLARCNKTTRHFKAEASKEDIEAASEVEYKTEKVAKLDAQKFDQLKRMGVGEGAEYFEGEIVFKDKGAVKCAFWVDYTRNSELVFLRGQQNVVVIEENDKGINRLDIDPTKLESFSFAGKTFRCLPYSPGSQLSMKKSNQIMEVLFESDRIHVYKFYPLAEANVGNTTTEVAFQKQSDKEFTSLGGMKFLNWKKGLSKYFADCPSVSKKAADGVYERTDNGVLDIAKAYTEECK